MAPDIIADTSTLAAACKEAIKKVEEAKLVVTMAGVKLFKIYRFFSPTRLDNLGRSDKGPSDASSLRGLFNPTH